jgi:hypothetical protein
VYRVRTRLDERAFSNAPDELYWTLDGLALPDNGIAVIERVDSGAQLIKVTLRDNGSFVIEYREDALRDPGLVLDVDILAAHQAILTCIRQGGEWRPVLERIQGTFGVFAVAPDAEPIDYEATGLSINNAMLDSSNRRRRLGLAVAVPPEISWGPLTIATGDMWTGVKEKAAVSLVVTGQRSGIEQGIAVSAPGGSLASGSESAESELIVWPTEGDREFVIDYLSPQRVIRLCNVYKLKGKGWSRVERWTDNAGLWVAETSKAERIYHCNHASTTPPTFEDLVFKVRMSVN